MISMLSEGLQKEVLLTECWIVEMENKGGVSMFQLLQAADLGGFSYLDQALE